MDSYGQLWIVWDSYGQFGTVWDSLGQLLGQFGAETQ
jgi:hypothetical protein